MTPDQFCYWLQGFAELHDAPPGREQWQSIREHLAAVFNKVTPPLHQPVPPMLIHRWPDPSYRQPDFVC